MSRSGYTDECENNWSLICYRGAVNQAIKGKRGQAFLREVLAALDAMPVKELIAGELEEAGQFCTLGIVGHKRGIDLSNVDTYETEKLADKFGIAESLAREIMWINDECRDHDWEHVQGQGWVRKDHPNIAAKRWEDVRAWVVKHIADPASMAATQPSKEET
jgi:hypothetical protein